MTSKPRRFAPRSAALVAFIGLVFLAAGAAAWFYPPPPEFTARMKLHVARNSPRILFPHKDSDEVDSNLFLRSQADLIRDRFTILAALREPGIANSSMLQEQKDPAQWLEEKITVEFSSPEYMNVTLSGDRGEELTKIVSAVTHAYLDNYVNKERNARANHRQELEESRRKFEIKMARLKRQLLEKQRAARAIDAEDSTLRQRLAAQDLNNVMKDLIQVRRELRNLRLELSQRSHGVRQVSSWCATAMPTVLPGPGWSIDQVVHLALLQQAMQRSRQRIQETLSPLESKEAALFSEAVRLSEQIRPRVQEAADVSQWQDDIDAVRKVLAKATDEINVMEVEQEAPSRITPVYDKPVLEKPNETKRKARMVVAASLTGVGMLLLLVAVFRFRAYQENDSVEHPSTPSSPE